MIKADNPAESIFKAASDAVVDLQAKGEESLNSASKVLEGNVVPKKNVTDGKGNSEEVNAAADNHTSE